MGANSLYTAGIIATLGSIVFLLASPPRNYPLAVCDVCTARLSFNSNDRYSPSAGARKGTVCQLSKTTESAIETSLVLAYTTAAISLTALVTGLHNRGSRTLPFFVLCSALLQITLLAFFVFIPIDFNCEAGSAVYLQALIAVVWGCSAIWHLGARKSYDTPKQLPEGFLRF